MGFLKNAIDKFRSSRGSNVVQDKDSVRTIQQIASSIKHHFHLEKELHIPDKAFARVCCNLNNNGKEVCWLTNNPYQGQKQVKDFTGSGVILVEQPKAQLESDGRAVYKNSKIGEIFTKNYQGTHSFRQPKHYGNKYTENTIEIFDKSEYSPIGIEPIEIVIRIAGIDKGFKFQRLSDITKSFENIQEKIQNIKVKQEQTAKELEEKKRIAEQKRVEEQQKVAEETRLEEQRRLEAEQRALEEAHQQQQKEIEELERKSREAEIQIQVIQSFMRKNVALRNQHLLDKYQEDAKRSHVFDKIPVLIEGGPGTGKTTTMIQRLMFLLSEESLKDYEAPLTKAQIKYLTEPASVNSKWLFFSPTELLLRYLQANMREEGLNANDTNTRTIPRFRNKIMKDYQLFNPAKDGPFKDYKVSDGELVLINNPEKVIADFEKYIIHSCVLTFTRRTKINTESFDWAVDAERIKIQCKRAISGTKDIDALMRIFNSLQDNEKDRVTQRRKDLKNLIDFEALKLKNQIIKEEEKVEELGKMFERWRRERLTSEEVDDEAIVDDEEDETEETVFNKYNIEEKLYSQLKQLLKQLGLREIDSKIKLSKRNQELFDCINSFIDENVKVMEIGQAAWFMRNFASLCRGIESNILGIIPKLYKDFRKTQLEGKDYNSDLLQKIISKDNNKHLHPDEQNLLIGFINEMLNSIYRKSRMRFERMKHKYAVAYKESVKHVIGIDEATDYSKLDFYFMVSFRHYEFSSITLCGDIMQGLNNNGINKWDELNSFLPIPNIDVKTLDISYRQLPTLLDLARELYRDDQGVYPSYESDKERSDNEPKPLLLISDDEEEKARWISDRIKDIYQAYNELPSIAIFVGDNVNIDDFIDRITELDLLNGIDIVDCSGNKQLQNKEQVRVFKLSEVKGMEFEAAFFYDIDDAIGNKDEQLMRRYLYVGISRATSHLAATMRDVSGFEDIVKYFDTEQLTWD